MLDHRMVYRRLEWVHWSQSRVSWHGHENEEQQIVSNKWLNATRIGQLVSDITRPFYMRLKTIEIQELLDMGMKMDQAIGHVWTGNTKKEQMGNIAKIVKGGHFAILSSCWLVGDQRIDLWSLSCAGTSTTSRGTSTSRSTTIAILRLDLWNSFWDEFPSPNWMTSHNFE